METLPQVLYIDTDMGDHCSQGLFSCLYRSGRIYVYWHFGCWMRICFCRMKFLYFYLIFMYTFILSSLLVFFFRIAKSFLLLVALSYSDIRGDLRWNWSGSCPVLRVVGSTFHAHLLSIRKSTPTVMKPIDG